MKMWNYINRMLLSVMMAVFIMPTTLCAINKYTVTVVQPNAIKPPVIQWVSVGSDQKNQIAWKKQNNDAIVYYNVYRSADNSDEHWELAGKVNYSSDTYLNDLNSFANTQSYKYRIGAVDQCGNEILSNEIIRSIFLKIKNFDQGIINLEWNLLDGLKISKYNIYRGTTADNMVVIDSVGANTYNFIDTVFASSNTYYRIEAEWPEDEETTPANLQPLRAKAQSNFIKAQSNTIVTFYDSIFNSFEEKNLIIYPNPMYTHATVRFPYTNKQQYQLRILDMQGNQLMIREIESGDILIDRNQLKEGMYILQIVGKKTIQKKLLVGGSKL